MYVLEWWTVSALTRGLFWYLFPELRSNDAINTKRTLRWARKQFVTRVHTLFYFFHEKTNPSMTTETMIFTHRPRISLARFSFCWWRHNRLLMTSKWPDNCDAITGIVISNSLDIDFIHGDIHGRSCKKPPFMPLLYVLNVNSADQVYHIRDSCVVTHGPYNIVPMFVMYVL